MLSEALDAVRVIYPKPTPALSLIGSSEVLSPIGCSVIGRASTTLIYQTYGVDLYVSDFGSLATAVSTAVSLLDGADFNSPPHANDGTALTWVTDGVNTIAGGTPFNAPWQWIQYNGYLPIGASYGWGNYSHAPPAGGYGGSYAMSNFSRASGGGSPYGLFTGLWSQKQSGYPQMVSGLKWRILGLFTAHISEVATLNDSTQGTWQQVVTVCGTANPASSAFKLQLPVESFATIASRLATPTSAHQYTESGECIWLYGGQPAGE